MDSRCVFRPAPWVPGPNGPNQNTSRIKTRLESKHVSNQNTSRIKTRLESKHASNQNTSRIKTRLESKHVSNQNTKKFETPFHIFIIILFVFQAVLAQMFGRSKAPCTEFFDRAEHDIVNHAHQILPLMNGQDVGILVAAFASVGQSISNYSIGRGGSTVVGGST